MTSGSRSTCSGWAASDGLLLEPGSFLVINHLNVYAWDASEAEMVSLQTLFPTENDTVVAPGDHPFGDGFLYRVRSDIDGDGVLDSMDNCKLVHNPDQADAYCNRVGDVCECGDANLDGRVTTADARLAQRCAVHEDLILDVPGVGLVDICEDSPLPPSGLLRSTMAGSAMSTRWQVQHR